MPCENCAKTGKDCGPKRRFDEDRSIRDEGLAENQFWGKVRIFIEERMRRGQSREEILEILDPDEETTQDTSQTETETDYDTTEPSNIYPDSYSGSVVQNLAFVNSTPNFSNQAPYGNPGFGTTQSQYGPPSIPTTSFGLFNNTIVQHGSSGFPAGGYSNHYMLTHHNNSDGSTPTIDPRLLQSPSEQFSAPWNNTVVSNDSDGSMEHMF